MQHLLHDGAQAGPLPQVELTRISLRMYPTAVAPRRPLQYTRSFSQPILHLFSALGPSVAHPMRLLGLEPPSNLVSMNIEHHVNLYRKHLYRIHFYAPVVQMTSLIILLLLPCEGKETACSTISDKAGAQQILCKTLLCRLSA